MVSSPVPALMMRAGRKVVDHLTSVGATSAADARTYLPSRHMERSALSYLQRHGVVQLAEGGRFWVDEDKAAGLRRRTRARAAVIAGSLVAAGTAVLLALRAGQ